VIKKSLMVLGAILLIAACASKPEPPKTKIDFTAQMERYYPLIEEVLTQRELSPSFFKMLEDELRSDGHLSAASIHALKQRVKEQKILRDALFRRAYRYEPWVYDDSIEPRLRLKGVLFSLSAAIVLYDNYLFNLSMFQQNHHLRLIVNAPDKAYHLESMELLRAAEGYTSVDNYVRIKNAIRFYQEESKKGYVFDAEMSYLQTLIENSPSYRALVDKQFFKIVSDKMYFYSRFGTDTVEILGDKGINLFSEIFGNSVGMIVTRKGLMYENTAITENVALTLRAGDILIEKTPQRLTDILIPGYWGHAAIWTGTPDELKELGVWEHPSVVPYHQQVHSNKRVIEALRSGVQLSSLGHFLNVDDLAVLREREMTRDEQREVVLNAFAQLGKSYDFNFNIESSDTIVCSELVYLSYPHIKWPTDKALGRYTISPDHIAEKTRSRELKLITLYHDGQKINDTKELWEKMRDRNALYQEVSVDVFTPKER